MESPVAVTDPLRAQKLIRSRVEHDAVTPADCFHDDKSNPGWSIRLAYVGSIDPLIAIKPHRHFTEIVFSNHRDETDFYSQPGAAHGLIGTFAAIIHPISRS